MIFGIIGGLGLSPQSNPAINGRAKYYSDAFEAIVFIESKPHVGLRPEAGLRELCE